MEKKIITSGTTEELYEKAAAYIAETLRERVKSRGYVTFMLSGGSTPRGLYERLAEEPYKDVIPWEDVYIFWSDERCVPHTSPESNYRMAAETLLNKNLIPEKNIFPVNTTEKPYHEAAEDYEYTIRKFFQARGERPAGFPLIDCILLGVGEDGHTASLFPGDRVLLEKRTLIKAVYAPVYMAPVQWRITATLPLIRHASRVVILAAGNKKKPIVDEVAHRDKPHPEYPIGQVSARDELVWFTDFPVDGD